MARRDPVGIRLITRGGHRWSARYPLVVEAVNHLKVRSCLIDGEVVCCNERGVATFQLLRDKKTGWTTPSKPASGRWAASTRRAADLTVCAGSGR